MVVASLVMLAGGRMMDSHCTVGHAHHKTAAKHESPAHGHEAAIACPHHGEKKSETIAIGDGASIRCNCSDDGAAAVIEAVTFQPLQKVPATAFMTTAFTFDAQKSNDPSILPPEEPPRA
jgi:hypothetical protein